MHYGAGYNIWGRHAESRHRGGVAVAWIEISRWQVDGVVNYRPNMIIFVLTTRRRIWYVVRAYVPRKDAPTVVRVEQTLGQAAKGVEVILMGDLNFRLGELRDTWEE